MANIQGGPPERGAWFAQQDPDGTTKHAGAAGAQESAAREEWAETHPNPLRRLLARLRRS